MIRKANDKVRRLIEKREFFNSRRATPETLAFREEVLENKEELYLLPIKTGDKTWYFGGAGEHKIMFFKLESGIDATNVSVGKFWVLYNKLNPIVKDQIELAIDNLNGENDVLKEKTPTAEVFPETFTRASEIEIE